MFRPRRTLTVNKGQVYERTPQISAELVQWLEQQFPLKSPELDASERVIFHAVGQRSVVDHLSAIHKEQSENVLET